MTTQSPRSLARFLLASLLALAACALPQRAASQALRTDVGPYTLEVRVDGAPARTYLHAGQSYVLGVEGSRYVLRIHNRSGRRIEAVVTVDGLDVIDGQPGDFTQKRGYLVPAYGFVDVEGFRLNEQEAAAFRFASVSASYAAKTGSARNVGVIGVAVFPERERPMPRRYVPYAPAPESSRSESTPPIGGLGRGARTRAAPEPKGSTMDREAPAAPAPSAARASAESAPAEDTLAEGAGAASQRRERSGLGTEFGEAVSSQIHHVSFERAHAMRPAVFLGARYNDRQGLVALGVDVDGEDDVALRRTAQPFPASPRRYATPPADWRRF